MNGSTTPASGASWVPTDEFVTESKGAVSRVSASARDGLCTIWPWTCPNTATLVVYGEGACECRPCDQYDDGLCRGHAVCDEHGAALRIRQHNQRPISRTGPPFVVARIHSLRMEAS